MAQKEEIRDHIIAVASDIFGKFGFRRTTMDEIAHATRKGKSTIYYYFKSKEDVFQAVVEREAQVLTNKVHEAIRVEHNPKDKIRTYILTRMRSLGDVVNFYNVLKNEHLTRMDFLYNIREKYRKEEISMVMTILQEGIDNGEFQVSNMFSGAQAIVATMHGIEVSLFLNTHIDIHDPSFEKRVDDILQIVFFGLMKR